MRSVQKNLYLLIILLISFPLNVLAQNKTITGTVRDADDSAESVPCVAL